MYDGTIYIYTRFQLAAEPSEEQIERPREAGSWIAYSTPLYMHAGILGRGTSVLALSTQIYYGVQARELGAIFIV